MEDRGEVLGSSNRALGDLEEFLVVLNEVLRVPREDIEDSC